jgi:D-alanyl-D-alanine carboxypeptidase
MPSLAFFKDHRSHFFHVVLCCFVLALSALYCDSAEARPRKRGRTAHHGPVYIPPETAMVIDSRTGHVLYAKNPDLLSPPASITKVMTLYLIFEDLKRGAIRLNSLIPVSAKAASQQPTRLGLSEGSVISLDTAIRALVVKSANDVAVAVAEWLGGGSEAAFVARMNQKAFQLGMTRTVFGNASGLPHPHQVSTARDLIILGQSIQGHFPSYYPYFSIQELNYNGRILQTHNKLLGTLGGVDGIKTGYTRASGFNLLTSARTRHRSILAVVMGGRTARLRDQWMAQLIQEALFGAGTIRSFSQDTHLNAEPVHSKQSSAALREAIRPSLSAPQAKDSSRARVAKEKKRTPIRIIQIGTMTSKLQAEKRLKTMKASSPLLAHAKFVTEKVMKKGSVFYRAGFTGLPYDKAQLACSRLRKNGFQCFVSEN